MAQVNVTLKDAKMPKVHMVQHTHPNDMRFAFWSCLRKVLTTRWIILYSSSTRQLLLNRKLGICGCWCLLNLENTAYLLQKRVFSHYASFTHMLNNWVGTLAPLTFHDFWFLFNLYMMFQQLILKCRFPFRSKLRSKRCKKVHPRTTWNPETKQIYKTYHPFFGFHLGFRFGWVFSLSPSHPQEFFVAVPSGTRHGCHITPPCGFTYTGGVLGNNLGIRWREEKLKQRRLGSLNYLGDGFKPFFIFTSTCGNDPNWLIFCKGFETTN